MTISIELSHFRKDVDNDYVGFKANGSSIKPVHIANGMMRAIAECVYKDNGIKLLALVSDAKGEVRGDNDLDTEYELLKNEDCLEDDITKEDLEALRNIMQRLLSTDKGVFVAKGLKENMISYSAGSKYFLTTKSLYEDVGEFIGCLIKKASPDLASHVKDIINSADDPITKLFTPVLKDFKDNKEEYICNCDELPIFKQKNNKNMKLFVNSLKDAGNCLCQNLKKNPNKLTQLRIVNFFSAFSVFRYMTMLESFYCDGEENLNLKPLLLDFSGMAPSRSSVARASETVYTCLYKSINRFYSWGYAEKLKNMGVDSDNFNALDTPVYTKGNVKKQDGLLWNLAKATALEICGEKNLSKLEKDNKVRLVLGDAMYDILATEASSHPVNFLRMLGTSSGFLYPPDKKHPNKRFVLSQDMIEMIMRCCVEPDEVITGHDLRERLWNRFGIVIGGTQSELDHLKQYGMFLQVDEDSLEQNFHSFCNVLESMGFAEIMADGILQIKS